MKSVLFTLGPVSIYAWGTMLSLAVIVGLLGTRRLVRRVGVEFDHLLSLTIWLVLAGLIGSRLFYVFFYEWDYYSLYPLEIFKLNQPGLVFYGGLIAGVLAGGIYIYRHRLPFWDLADVIAPFLALGYGMVRIGCFLNGCCYGKPTGLPWGVVFPGLGAVPRHPTQLYSTIFALFLFVGLLWLFQHRRFPGQVFLVYLMVYAGLRFIVEFFRENLLIWGSLTIAQLVSLLILGIAVGVYWYQHRRAPEV